MFSPSTLVSSSPFVAFALIVSLLGILCRPSSAFLTSRTQVVSEVHPTATKIRMAGALSATTRLPAAAAAAATNGSSPQSLKVAIIGAGAAGLTAARQLSKIGIVPTVLEKDAAPGGVWNYVPNASDRPMYRGLRTNLPRELMAFREKPWGGDGKGKSYVTHRQVLDYLKEYAEDFDLQKCVRYGCRVCQLTMMTAESSSESSAAIVPNGEQPWPKVRLEWESDKSRHTAEFDACIICNGHYAAPSNPIVPGLSENFKGKTMHSVEYDDPTQFQDQVVLCIGGRASGSDLAREISQYATKVYLSDSSCEPSTDGQPRTEGNVHWVPRTMSVDDEGAIHFDGCDVAPSDVDVVVFCSGYDYRFPFLNEDSQLDLQCTPGERRVAPLYRQLWHARYPNLSFVGLQHSVVPFPFFETQAQAVVAALLGEAALPLPTLEVRMESAKVDAESGGPKDPGRLVDTHFLGSYQWNACREYAKIAGVYDDEMEKFIATNKEIYDHSGKRRKALFPGGKDTYREDIYVREEENQSSNVDLAQDSAIVAAAASVQ